MRQRGFTLIELIVVITLLSVISLVTVSFIGSTMQGYADLTRRDQLSAAARVAVDRMTREVRSALPNSIRINATGTCLEFIPALAASRYSSVPLTVSAASSSFSSVPFAEEPERGRVAVYPIDSNRQDEVNPGGDDIGRDSSLNPIYDLDSWSIISPQMSASNALASATGNVTLNLTAAHSFPAGSPSYRYFIVDEPVSFCLVGSDLYRFQGEDGSAYSFAVSQPSAATLYANLNEPQRILLASDIVTPVDNSPFRYLEATLQRNGLVLFDLLVEDQELSVADQTRENIRVQFEVQVKNAP